MNDAQLLKKLVALRRAIHRNPELGNREFKTAALVEKTLRGLRIPRRRISPTGVVATLSSGRGKCVALRADMDALPLDEQNRTPYRSQVPGVMHACGHDAHVAMLLGAAALLSEKRDFKGTVRFLFQPNEEGAGGAKGLIKGGCMKNPTVDAVFGLHVNPRLPAGAVGLKPGPLMAAVDQFSIEIAGKGGHAAYPHEGVDAIPVAAELVQALQAVVSRKIDPLDAAVLTIGTIKGGTRFNILAESVELSGTVRTLSEKAHREIPRLIRRTAEGVCRAHGARARVRYQVLGSVLSNTPAMVEFSRRVASGLFGARRVLSLETATMGGEDFAEYLQSAPGCFIYIGTGPGEGRNLVPWHHPAFDIDESALPVGSKLLAGLARDFLS